MKAQFWSFDAIFAMVIFGTALVLLTFVLTGISSQFSLAYGLGVENIQAQLQSLQSTILTQGTPPNWNSFVSITNLTTWLNVSIGLGTGNGTALSLNKIMTLMAMSNYNYTTYQATKPLLGIGYDYYIVIYYNNATIALGLAPYKYKPTALQVAGQSAVLNGVPVRMQIIVWTNKTFGVG
jgi:hypothetical protein